MTRDTTRLEFLIAIDIIVLCLVSGGVLGMSDFAMERSCCLVAHS